MSFLFNNLATIAVALVASTAAWLFGGTRGGVMIHVSPWLLAFMLEIVVCFPQRHKNETTYEARDRVWSALRRDPLTWISLGLFALLLVPFVNNGLCPRCDAAKIAEGISAAPPVSFLPFCVSRIGHLDVVQWFALALVCMVAVRHSLTRHGKRQVLALIVWNGAALAVFGFVQQLLGAPGPLWWVPAGVKEGSFQFFATFGYTNMAGDYFTALLGVALALWRDQCDQRKNERMKKSGSEKTERVYGMFWRKHYFLIPAAIFYFAALNTLSRAAIILATSLVIVCFAHTLVTVLSRMRRAKRVVVGVWSLLAFGVIVFFASLFMPESIQKEVNTLGTTEVLDRVTGKGQYHVQVATELWKDHKLFGCGGWGYQHLCVPKMIEIGIDLRTLQTTGGANVHNDHLQFLAEHGLVGFGAMVVLVVLLLTPVYRGWRQLVKALRFIKRSDPNCPPRPMQLFVLPAPVFFLLVTVLATVIHAFGDCPLRSSAALTLFFVELAALPGFMVRIHEEEPKSEILLASHHHHHHHH